MHQTKDEFATMLKKMANFMPTAQDRLLELEKLACLANVPTSKDARVSLPIAKESTVTLASKSLELSTNGISHVLDDVAEVTAVGLERVSSDPTDVVVALSVGEKCDSSLPSDVSFEVQAQIRRIFLDGYGVLDVRISFLHFSSFKL
ncbi:hypothetical protein Tco_0629921 [Tanacetum coccineum]|uniref:Uncharacterized protein n=1 Tax=Tanacetum coccineum TaxID=301880 RepID=A0ABQ4WUI5_9ASTR